MEVTSKNDLSDFSQLNVLIIDDNRLVHDVLKNVFFNLGFQTVRCAENAYYGLRLADETRFHIIICAFNVKSDKDGFHLLEELKFKGHVKKTTVLIFLSTETDESLVNSIIELQPDDFWAKPLSPGIVQKRLLHTLAIKKQLFSLYYAIDTGKFSKVIYYADRLLQDPSLVKLYPNIKRMKGEAYLSLLEFKEAESFYEELLDEYKFSWVYNGYVKSLLKQERIDEIHALIEELLDKPDTRFAMHDLLAQYHMETKDYELAYEEIQKAMRLAPRNIERNKKSWDLARLTHDHYGQYQATRNIAKFARNSIHDSPELLLNVIRSGIDLACTITDDSSTKILDQVERYINDIENNYDEAAEFRQQILVAQARLHNAREHRNRAQAIIDNHIKYKPSPSIEDNLDKVKVFHELGMREEAKELLGVIKNQIAGNSLTTEVMSQYIEQETEEREEVHFTPKQLNKMAVEFFQKNKLQPALDSVTLALKLAPNNIKLQFSLFKILIVLKEQGDVDHEHTEVAENLIKMLDAADLDKKKQDAFIDLKEKWLKEKRV